MGRVKLRIMQEDEVCVNVHVNLDSRGSTGYETSVELYNKNGDGWVASMSFSDMPPQESFEDAIDRLGLYLRKMSTAIKSKNFKGLNPDPIFKDKHF